MTMLTNIQFIAGKGYNVVTALSQGNAWQPKAAL